MSSETEEKFRNFSCEYQYRGSKWSVMIKARTHQEAESRLRAIGNGRLLGEHVMTVPASVGGGAIARGLCWINNTFRKGFGQ